MSILVCPIMALTTSYNFMCQLKALRCSPTPPRDYPRPQRLTSLSSAQAPTAKSLWLHWWYQGLIGCVSGGECSDERAECLCNSKPLGQAPVGAHQLEVGENGSSSGGCLGWGFTEMEDRLWVMTIEIFLGGAEHGDELRAEFHLGSLFTSEVEVGEGGTSFSSFFPIFC